MPTRLAAGQLGEACSALPSRAAAAASAASGQYGTPASLATSPMGSVVSIAFRRWLPSGRASFITNGVYAAALGSIVPPLKVTVCGSCRSEPTQAESFAPRLTV